MADEIFTSRLGSLWLTCGGPLNCPEYIACTDAADIAEPLGDTTLMQCFDVNGRYKTVGKKKAAPGAVTTTLTQLTFTTRSYLERIKGKFGIIFLERDGGRADDFSNWRRALVLQNARVTSKTFGGVLKRETEDDTTRGFAISALPPVLDIVPVEANMTDNQAAGLENSCIAFIKEKYGLLPWRYGVSGTFSAVGPAKAHVYYTNDGGSVWHDTAAQPFAAGVSINACAIVDMGGGIKRLIVAQEPIVAGQGRTSYSDDWGATWTPTLVGGAAAAHGAVDANALFALDPWHIWLVSAKGYIYFSGDGSETWTVQEAGAISVADYLSVAFLSDGLVGYAGNTTAGVVKTIDGGVNWYQVTWLIVTAVYDISLLDADRFWVSVDTDGLMFSPDGGDNFYPASYPNKGTFDDVIQVAFVNDYVGFALATDGTDFQLMRTIDGGCHWQLLQTDWTAAASTIMDLVVGTINYAVVAGWDRC